MNTAASGTLEGGAKAPGSVETPAVPLTPIDATAGRLCDKAQEFAQAHPFSLPPSQLPVFLCVVLVHVHKDVSAFAHADRVGLNCSFL